ncbi:MAG: protein kinase [Verrucomicrobiia bacterium]|jgi:tRNA A-37 threonylcarbamoyl transferase component Bud32
MSEEKRCAQCGAVLAADAPQGLCPACLLKRGFASSTGAGESNDPEPRTDYVPPSPIDLARFFPELEILGLVGRGGMGVVYKARQKRLDRLVALKILPPNVSRDPAFSERFTREAKALARLTHPNIVSVHDFGQTDGLFYFVMEFVDGMNLRQLLDTGKIAPKEALAIVPQICDALQYAHDKGIVHRDIKPENILIDKSGVVKIADFGLAKLVGLEAKDLTITSARDVIGTPLYMAPEQIEHPQDVDHRADIYSLGVVFYQMLTGELPIGRFAPPSKKVRVDVRLDEVVLHALEKEPQRRYQQASQVKTAVETINGTPTQLVAPTAGRPLSSTGIITAPAVALMVAGLWKLFSVFVALSFLASGSGWLGKFLGLGSLLGSWGPVAIVSVVLFRGIPGLLIMFGGFQMLQRRSYAWAIAAGIISIVACSLIGFPIGIWALIVLARDDVKSAFGSNASVAPVAPRPDHFWRRFAVVAGCIVLIPFVLAVIGLLAAMFLPALKTARDRTTEVTAQNLQQAGIHQDASGEFRKDSRRSFPFNAGGRFSVDNVKGRIEIHGWNTNAVVINAAIHGKTSESVEAVAINIDSGPDRAVVHTEQPSSETGFPWSWLWFGSSGRNNASVDYTIQVPRGARLANISSVSGHIVIDGVAGDIDGSTVNGETEIKDAARNLKLATVNGRITANMISLGGGQSVSLEAVNGEIELTLPDNADASLSVSTVNGSIASEFPSLTAEKEFPVGNNLKGSLGNGGATVKIAAVNGTVRIAKNQAVKQTATTPAEDAGETVAGQSPVAVETEPNSGLREVIGERIRNEVGRQLHESGASFDNLQVAVAEERDSGTPFAVSYRGLRNFKFTHGGLPDPKWPASANGQFIMQYIGGGQWQGALGDTPFTVQVGRTDNIDLPFVNDPQVIGEWESVDLVTYISDFDPERRHWLGDLYLKGLTFLDGGNTPQPWWTWTKGILIHHGDRTASHYEIREIKGLNYLFLEWKSGDVTIRGMKSDYYVLKRKSLESVPSSHDAGETVASQPPVVVRTQPLSGARDTEPGIAEIRVTFSKEMADGSWSWAQAWRNSTPERVGEPRYESDHRTCVINVKLEPGRTYGFWINSEEFQNFKDRGGRTAVPYLLVFRTKEQ